MKNSKNSEGPQRYKSLMVSVFYHFLFYSVPELFLAF